MQRDLVCRGCLAVDGKFSYIHDFSTGQAYESLLGIPLSPRDGFPSHMCSFCIWSLRKFAEFKQRCLRALEVLRSAKTEGRLITRKNWNSVTSSCPELTPRYARSKTCVLEVLKQETEDDLLQPTGDFIYLVEKEEILSENETGDNYNTDMIETEHEVKVKPYAVYVDDFINEDKSNLSKVKKEKRKVKRKDRVKKAGKKKGKSDRQIVMDYAKSAGFDIAFLSHGEQIAEVEVKRSELSSGHNCRQCGKHFDDSNALERHQKNYHVLRPDSFMCDICSCVFKNKRSLRSHMTNHGWVFTCQSCDFKTKQRTVLRRHKEFHEGKKYPCKYCDREFTKSTTYLTHVRLRHASRLSWCNLCGEFFISEKGVENHKNLTHDVANEFPCVCAECDRRFKSVEALDRHTAVSGCNQPSCAQCGDAFPDPELLKYHLVQRHLPTASPLHYDCDSCQFRLYSGEARARHACGGAPCAACGARLADRAALLDHVRLCHDIFKCEECGKQFSSSAYFKRHAAQHARGEALRTRKQGSQPGQHRLQPRMRATTRTWRVAGGCRLAVDRLADDGSPLARDDGDMAAMCEVCGKKFWNTTQLRSHQRFHSLESQFSCSLCRKGFKQRAQLQMHTRVHTGERPYKCVECPKAFKTYQAYTRHHLIHSGLRKHVCQLCDKTFQTSTAAKTHIKTVHMKLPARPRARRRREPI